MIHLNVGPLKYSVNKYKWSTWRKQSILNVFIFTQMDCWKKKWWIADLEAVCDVKAALVVSHGVGDPLAEHADLEEKRIHKNHISASY